MPASDSQCDPEKYRQVCLSRQGDDIRLLNEKLRDNVTLNFHFQSHIDTSIDSYLGRFLWGRDTEFNGRLPVTDAGFNIPAPRII